MYLTQYVVVLLKACYPDIGFINISSTFCYGFVTMPKINGNEIRPGNVLEHNDGLWAAVKVDHVKPGKGGAFAQVEMKNLRNGSKLNERFRSAGGKRSNSREFIQACGFGQWRQSHGATVCGRRRRHRCEH
jgi:hypothetical protein